MKADSKAPGHLLSEAYLSVAEDALASDHVLVYVRTGDPSIELESLSGN